MTMTPYWTLPGDSPFPMGLKEHFQRRELVLDFADGTNAYNTTDWTQTLAAGGAIALAAGGASFSYPVLSLSTAAAADQAAAVRAQKWIQMPKQTVSALQNPMQAICFEFGLTTTLSTNMTIALGIASGTPTEFQTPADGTLLSAGAGIAWQKLSGQAWRFAYKTAAGVLTVLTTGVGATTLTQNRMVRCGWTVVHGRGIGSPTAATIYPFFQTQTDPDGVYEPNPLTAAAFYPNTAGYHIANADADAAETQCGIAMSMVGAGAGARTVGVSRILYADNLVR